MNAKKASWLLLFASAMWGSSFVASKICINGGMREFEIIFCRFGLGAIFTLIAFFPKLRHPTRTAIRTGVILGLLTAVTFTLEMFGLSMTQTTKAAFLTATNIVMMPFLYAVFCGVKPTKWSVGAALTAMLGVGLLTGLADLGGFSVGDILLLLDALCYGLNSIITFKMAGEDSRVQISFFQFLTTGVCMGILTAIQGTGGQYNATTIPAILYLAAVPTVLCYIIKNYTMKFLNPMRCTLILATESMFCAVFSALILHDRLTPVMWGGVALICVGILIELLHPTADSAQPDSSET